MTALYMGCWEKPGHFLHDERGRNLREHVLMPGLDGAYVPGNAKSGPEGVARLSRLTGFTILAFRDSSVDRRGGSHSTFVLDPGLDYDAALAAAREAFPFVFARLEARGVQVVPEAS